MQQRQAGTGGGQGAPVAQAPCPEDNPMLPRGPRRSPQQTTGLSWAPAKLSVLSKATANMPSPAMIAATNPNFLAALGVVRPVLLLLWTCM